MAKVLRIAKWKETFEKSDAQRLKSLPWISIPTSMDSNGFVLMAEDFGNDAPSIYGAWIALCQYAAGCTVRGTLATSRGEPIPLSRVARKAGWPLSVFERLVEWATSDQIGWIEASDDIRTPSGSHPYYGHNGHNITDGRTEPPDEKPPVRPICVLGLWEKIKPLAEEVHAAVDPDTRKLKPIDRELAIQFASLRVGYPEMDAEWCRIMDSLKTRRCTTGSIKSPWAWLKSELIRVGNELGPGYDGMVNEIKKKPPPVSNNQPPGVSRGS